MIKIKWLKDWKDEKIGDISNAGEKSAENFVSQGYAEYVVEKPKKVHLIEFKQRFIPHVDEDYQKNLVELKDNFLKEVEFWQDWCNKQNYIPDYKRDADNPKLAKVYSEKLKVWLWFEDTQYKEPKKSLPSPIIEELPEDGEFPFADEVFRALAVKDYDTATEILTNAIKDKYYIYTTRDDIKSEMWIYNEGIYEPNGKTFIREYCRKILGAAYSTFLSNIVISKIETDTYIEHDDFFETKYVELMPVVNGLLNVITKELSPFDPKKVFFNKLPVIYNGDAKCPNVNKFLSEILSSEEDITVAYELIGCGLYRDYFTEKAAMFVGDGRNGKSKFLELVKRLVGVKNTASVPIRSMKEQNSSLCELHGKLFNLAGDLGSTDLKDTGVFKETVGRDQIQAHRKFLRDLTFVNHAKHIFACNELPRVYDTTSGFWDKWILLEFPYKFITEKEMNLLSEDEKKNTKIKDPNIIEKISTTEELSGLLNNALVGLHAVIENKNFSQTKGSAEIKNFWIRNSDSFAAFCIDKIREDFEGFITKKELRKEFNRYCKKHKLKGVGDKSIKITLEDRFGVMDNRKTVENEFINVWEGIKFNKDL